MKAGPMGIGFSGDMGTLPWGCSSQWGQSTDISHTTDTNTILPTSYICSHLGRFSVSMVTSWSSNSMPGLYSRGKNCKMHNSIYRQACVDNNIIVSCSQTKQTLLLFSSIAIVLIDISGFVLKAETIQRSVFFSSVETEMEF